jgi:hypothetical protein
VKRFLLILLATSLYSGTAWAAKDRTPAPPPPPPRAQEPARPPPSQPKLSAEDQEVVENLELLESMDTAEDLDLLMELSKEE